MGNTTMSHRSPQDPIHLTNGSGFSTIVLRDNDTLNALDLPKVRLLRNFVLAARESRDRVLFILSTAKHFSSGLDLSDLDKIQDSDLVERFVMIQLLLEELRSFPGLTVARVNGAAIGAGADLAMACAQRVGDESTRFRFPGAAFGVVLGQQRLNELLNRYWVNKCVTGEWIGSNDALEAGFIDEVIDPGIWDVYADGLVSASNQIDEAAFMASKQGLSSGGAESPMSQLVRSLVDGKSIGERVTAHSERSDRQRANRRIANSQKMEKKDD